MPQAKSRMVKKRKDGQDAQQETPPSLQWWSMNLIMPTDISGIVLTLLKRW